MSEPTIMPVPAAPAVTPPAAPVPAPEAPPWGTDFDPARAWHTIQTLRARESELEKRPVLTPDAQAKLTQFEALEQASKTDAQRLAEETATAQREAQAARDEANRYKVALAHGIPVDDFDLLGTGTEEEITARAVKLAAKNAAQAAAAAVVPPVTPPGTRPVETLRPGATPSEAQTTDDAVMARLFGPGH